VCDWQTIQNTIHSLVNSHISMSSDQFSHFRDKMSLARDTGHCESIPGRSRPFRDGWQAYFHSATLSTESNADFISIYATWSCLLKFQCNSANNLKANMASIVDRPAVKPDCCGLRHLSSRGWSQLETDIVTITVWTVVQTVLTAIIWG